MKDITVEYINNFIKNHPEMEYLRKNINETIEMIVELKKENKLMVCGNGGSAADSEHIAGEFLKSFLLKRPIPEDVRFKLKNDWGDEGLYIADNLQVGVKCIPLTSFTAFNTAFLNDCDGDMLFAQLVNALGIENDILIAISTSGNSKNVVFACKVAKTLGIKVVALTGESGGALAKIADVLINVPSNIVYKIQEMHLPIYHLICLCVESELFEK